MTPTVVEDPEGRLFMVLGSPGGSRIITSVFQALTHVIDYRMDPQTAVDRPRFHHQWLPDRLEVERAFPATQLARLEALGWEVRPVPTFGAVNAVVVRYDDAGRRTLYGAADYRRDNDTAAGY